MFTRIWRAINDLLLRLALSLKRFPEALALALAIVVILIFINHNHPQEDTLSKVAMVLALGIPLSLCIRMLEERNLLSKVTGIIFHVLGAVGLVLYYHFFLPDLGMVAVSRYIAITIALYLLFLVIPYWGRREGFEIYVIKLFTGFIVTYFYSLILFLGLVAILFTVNTLFSAGISNEVYFDLFFIVGGIFAPAYFLSGVPAYGVVYGVNEYPKFLKVLLLYIVMPLLTVYTGILYVYFIKILVTRYWPAGIVSHLVLWYSFITIAVIFLIFLLQERSLWARTFSVFLPKLILPLLTMMFFAIGIRINAYGFTENRYFVLAGGIWATGSMLYYAFKKHPRHIKVLVAAALIAVLAVTGPWSCYEVSKYSQNLQFEKLLVSNNMLINGKIVPSSTISVEDRVSISSIIQYFDRKHSLSELKLLPPDFTLEQMKEVFGFELTYSPRIQYFYHHVVEEGKLLDVRDYDYYLPSTSFLNQRANTSVNNRGENLSISFAHESGLLKISKQDRLIYEKDLKEVALAIHEANRGADGLNLEDMTVVEENEHLKILVQFLHISGTEENEAGEPRIDWLDFSLLLKVKE